MSRATHPTNAVPPTRPARRTRGGFTLIELLLAVTMLSIVMYMTMESLTRQQKTSVVTDQIVEVQNNVRAVAALLEREIRMAGFMVPDAVGVCGVDRTNGADELFVSEIEPIVPDDERAGDLGARFSAGVNYAGTGTYNLNSTTTDLDGDGSFFYDNDSNGTPEADFRVGGGYIVGDLANPHRGSACGTVSAASATQIQVVQVAGGLQALAGTDAPEELVIVPAAHYRIDTGFTTGRLERNGDLLVNGVDDFQISYFYDVDDDGVEDVAGGVPTEEPGSTGAANYDPSNWDGSTLKEVRFSIVLRTRATDSAFDDGAFLNFENRVAVAGNDNFRRRVLVGAVRPRNMGMTGSI